MNSILLNKIKVKGGRLKKGIQVNVEVEFNETSNRIQLTLKLESPSTAKELKYESRWFSYRHIRGCIPYKNLWSVLTRDSFTDSVDPLNHFTQSLLQGMLKNIYITLNGRDELNPEIKRIVIVTKNKHLRLEIDNFDDTHYPELFFKFN